MMGGQTYFMQKATNTPKAIICTSKVRLMFIRLPFRRLPLVWDRGHRHVPPTAR
jgi:hypothetical protein